MVIFNSYVKLPEGNSWRCEWKNNTSLTIKKRGILKQGMELTPEATTFGGYDFWRLRLFGPILTITFQQVDNDAGKKAVNRVLGITGCA